jgi:uncharacterized lipoprotein YajG
MMNKITGVVMASLLALTGCAKPQPVQSLVTPPAAAAQPVAQNTPVGQEASVVVSPSAQPEAAPLTDGLSGNMEQCRKELDAMRLYSKVSYANFNAELQKIDAQTHKYLQIKQSIGADINDLVMPRYQFQARELCFRIKNRLSQLIIRQAG